MQSDKISEYLVQYLYALKMNEKNEVYETVLLMILNDNFLKSLNDLIIKNVKKVKQIRGKIKFEIHSSKEYEEAIDLVCKSKYFIENFTKPEIERRRTIAKNIIVEILLQTIFSMIQGDIKVNVNHHEVMYPDIDHKTLEEDDNFTKSIQLTFDKGVNANHPEVIYPDVRHKILGSNFIKKIQLTFNEDTPLDNIIKYLKEVLKLKNKPKKKKMSLGQSFRMLQISNEIKDKTLNYKKQKYEYNEQIVAREMFSRYREKVTMEAVAKSLQRIKKIKKEINTF